MDSDKLFLRLQEIAGESGVMRDTPLSGHTSFKLGGPADFLVSPADISQIALLVQLCRSEDIPLFVMGNGTNLIVRDKGIRGVVIKTFPNLENVKIEGEEITAEAGILLSKLSNIALEQGLTGLEFASGIPGTLGGAITMNAGAYGPEIKDVVIETEYLDENGEIKSVSSEQHDFGYRTSFVQKGKGFVLKSRVRLKKGNRDEIKTLMDELNSRRRQSQPLEMPSAGSVFRRPAGYYTGKLIQDCGLKGFRIGGAEVSSKHSGFIVNTGSATAADVISLIRYIQTAVKDKFGIELVTEVKIVGEE